MNVPSPLPAFNIDFPPGYFPSRREAHKDCAPDLFLTGTPRIRYRVRITWADPSTPSGAREEIRTFARPDRLLDLLRRIQVKPDRPLLSIRIEAKAQPRWSRVTPAFLFWRVGDHARQATRGSR